MLSHDNMEHKLLWFKLKDVMKFKEIPKYSSKIITKTNNMFHRMNKFNSSSKHHIQYNNMLQDNNLHLTDLYCSKPNTKENLKLELIKMLMPRGAELSRKELQLELNNNTSSSTHNNNNSKTLIIRKMKSFYPKIKTYQMSLKKNPYITHINRSNSMLTLPKHINIYNHSRNEFFPISNITISNKSLSNCSSYNTPKHSTYFIKPFLQYTKHTEKVQLYRNKLTKIEEDIRRDINCSVSGLNWFNREYNKKNNNT